MFAGVCILNWDKGRVQKKKLWKSGQADRLGWPPPPLPRSGQENVKISRQVAIFGVILSFYKGQKWVKIFTNRSGQAEGGWPPLPPQSGQPDCLFTVFFLTLSLFHIWWSISSFCWFPKHDQAASMTTQLSTWETIRNPPHRHFCLLPRIYKSKSLP